MTLSLSGLSGEGHQPLDPLVSVAVTFIDIIVTTAPIRARKIGDGTIPKAIWNIGQFGLGWFTDDASGNATDQLAETNFIHQTQETVRILNAQGGATFFGSFWWRLAPGVVIDAVIES